MKAELLLFPYDAAESKSLFHRLIAELSSGGWARLRAAVAFARVSGNSIELLDALVDFAVFRKNRQLDLWCRYVRGGCR